MNLTLGLSVDLKPAEARALLTSALENNLPSEEQPSVPRFRISLYLTASLQALLASATGKKAPTSLEMAREAEGRIYAAFRSKSSSQDSSSVEKTEPLAVASGDTLTRSRQRLLDFVLAGIQNGKIVAAEASTGFGKSRIIGKCASAILDDPETRVVIAAPTIAVMAHLAQELRKADRELSPNILLGRRQFLSLERCREGLDQIENESPVLAEEVKKARQWLDRGAPTVSNIGKAVARNATISHLVEDLSILCPNLPASDWALFDNGSSAKEPGEGVYSELRGSAKEGRLIMMSHAMLALSLMQSREESVMEKVTHVLIDEAHELEETVARTLGTEISLFAFRAWLKKHQRGKNTPELVSRVSDLISRLKREESGSLTSEEKITEIKRDCAKLEKLLTNGGKEMERWRDSLLGLKNAKGKLYIMHSPVLRYPSIIAGPSSISVARYLEGRLWNNVEGGGLFSATIFSMLATGKPSTGYFQLKLGIPMERFHAGIPFNAPFVLETPTVFYPDPKHAKELSFPAAELRESEGSSAESIHLNEWWNQIAASVRAIAATAKGGTLVLTNSHSDLREIRKRCVDELGSRLVGAGADRSTGSVVGEFIEAGQQGRRPVWIATGGAWTGVDLRDPDAERGEDDFVITDLVITRVPFGMNKTSTHITRRDWLGFAPEIHEAQIRFRQGIGRLVRREHTLHRRLWCLDGRIHTNKSFKSFMRILQMYPKNQYFTLPIAR